VNARIQLNNKVFLRLTVSIIPVFSRYNSLWLWSMKYATVVWSQCSKGKKKDKVIPLRSIEVLLGDRRYSSYSFLTSALEGGWVVSITLRPRFTPGQRAPGTHCTGGWVGPRAGLDAEVRGKILFPCRESNPGRPVHSQDTVQTDVPRLSKSVHSSVCMIHGSLNFTHRSEFLIIWK
jgi:hypothetical protein